MLGSNRTVNHSFEKVDEDHLEKVVISIWHHSFLTDLISFLIVTGQVYQHCHKGHVCISKTFKLYMFFTQNGQM